MSTVAVVTGATRNLGFCLAQGLARRLGPDDVVYLTGRDTGRVTKSARRATAGRAEVRGEILDVADRSAIERFACALGERHGGVDIVFSNHYARVQRTMIPRRSSRAMSPPTTSARRTCAPSPLCCATVRACRRRSRAGSLRALAPALHGHFEKVDSLTTSTSDLRLAGRCATAELPARHGRAGSTFPPRSAKWRRSASSPPASRRRSAPRHPGRGDFTRPNQHRRVAALARHERRAASRGRAGPLLDVALAESSDDSFYGELVHLGHGERQPFRSIVPWK